MIHILQGLYNNNARPRARREVWGMGWRGIAVTRSIYENLFVASLRGVRHGSELGFVSVLFDQVLRF